MIKIMLGFVALSLFAIVSYFVGHYCELFLNCPLDDVFMQTLFGLATLGGVGAITVIMYGVGHIVLEIADGR